MKRRNLIAGAALLPFAARAAEAPLKIGSPAGPFGDILGFAIERAHAQGLEVRKIEFTDWITPNEALAAGDIDANLFQHIPFLNAAIKARGYKLVPIAATTVMPMALFSHRVRSLDQVPANATVAIANDPVNGARGLQLFQKGGLITLKPRLATMPQWRTSSPTPSTCGFCNWKPRNCRARWMMSRWRKSA